MQLANLGYGLAPLIGFMTLAIGICAMIWPSPMAMKFGIAADKSALPYVVSTGVRDVFMGLTVLTLFYVQLWSALGVIHLGISLVAISDFKLVYQQGIKKVSYVHLFGAIVTLIYGLWLLLA